MTGFLLSFNENVTTGINFFNDLNTNELITTFMYGATDGTSAISRAVSPGQALTGTGDWIVIGYLIQGIYTFNTGIDSNKGINWCSIAVNGVSYHDSNSDGFIQ